MADWTRRGTDSRDIGVCFYCGEPAQHFDHELQLELCSDPQCMDEALRCSDAPTEDLVDRFNRVEGKENNSDDMD